MEQERYLIFSEWNSGSEISKESEIIVKNFLNQNKQIILLGTQIERWIDEPVVSVTTSNFCYHSFFEEIIDETTNKTLDNTKNIEYLILQILYYSYKYNVSKFIFIGTFFDSFDFLARLTLITDFTIDVHCYVIDKIHSFEVTNDLNEIDEFYDKKFDALREAYKRCKIMYTQNNYYKTLNLPVEILNYERTILTDFVTKYSIEEARIKLIESLGIELPLMSNIYFCCNQDPNYIIDIITNFEKKCDTLNDIQLQNDYNLLLLLQPRESKEIIDKLNSSRYARYILFIPRYLPKKILNELYCATQYGIHGDNNIFTLEHQYFERIQLDCNELSKNKKTKFLNYSYYVPNLP